MRTALQDWPEPVANPTIAITANPASTIKILILEDIGSCTSTGMIAIARPTAWDELNS
jgi:hypothetical protein